MYLGPQSNKSGFKSPKLYTNIHSSVENNIVVILKLDSPNLETKTELHTCSKKYISHFSDETALYMTNYEEVEEDVSNGEEQYEYVNVLNE